MIISPFFKKSFLATGVFVLFPCMSFGMDLERYVTEDGIICEDVGEHSTKDTDLVVQENTDLFQPTLTTETQMHFLTPVVFIPIHTPINIDEALWAAARYGDCQFILSAIKQGLVAVDAFDVKNHNRTALMEAARIGKLQACYQLIDLGANKFLIDRKGNTAFGCAVLGHVYRTANSDKKNDFFLYPCVRILQLLLDSMEYEYERVIVETLQQTNNERLHESTDLESFKEIQNIIANRVLDNVYRFAVTSQARPEVLRCIEKEKAILNSDWDEVIRLLD